MAEHEAIIKAICDRDADGAHAASHPHFAARRAGLPRYAAGGVGRIVMRGESVAFFGFSSDGQMAGGCARLMADRPRQVVLVSTSNLGIPRGTPEPTLGWRKLETRAERDAIHRRN